MDKFTKVQKEGLVDKKDNQVLFEENDLKVIKYKDTNFVQEKDLVVILPYIKSGGFFILKHEYLPTYNFFYRNNEQYKNINSYISVITGVQESGENLNNTVRRILFKETGIVLSNMYQIEFKESLFIHKTNASKYIPVILDLNFNEYKETISNYNDVKITDMVSKCIKISLGDIDELRCHDLITSYMINLLKSSLNIK
jgi:hypothetical protein